MHAVDAALYAELEKLPENLVGEILDGELFASPRPASPHAFATAVMGSEIVNRFHGPADGPGAPGGWWVLFEPELHLGPDVLVPDLAAWRHGRMPRVPSVSFFTLAPDWVCEVLSPSTAQIDRVRKMRIYAREAVGHLWIVDPLLRTLEVYRRGDEHWIVDANFAGADGARAEPFAQVELALSRWWLEATA